MSKVLNNEAKSARALYFSKKYGMVFGQGDLNLNFSDIASSSSKLGQTFQVPDGQWSKQEAESALSGSGTTQFGSDIVELEVYAIK